ncbi:TetR/AcrR family transcriptional regulator [Paenibacillus sp. YYML68]|uniref:TetR/AcrR family transcriptional regulator n=1 Tax=Paenibacillus sp. YYML68 TaxID=2909250 RepID=UPI00249167DD|nr:TetR/AcrR family transcriptional regulator [Paenibacillus sp. YYML68]
MPKKFGDAERDVIMAKLQEEGRRLFGTLGLKKTSVSDLTRSCGISQGAFYLFYSSKEELFFDLIEQEEQAVRERMLQLMELQAKPSADSVALFLQESLRAIEASTVLQQMLEPGQLELLLRKLPPERLARNAADDQDALQPVVERWQQAGLASGTSPELIVSMLRAVILLSLHKKEIGEDTYEPTMQLLFRTIGAGLAAMNGGNAR